MESEEQKIKFIAKACHEVNRVWCQANGDESQSLWEHSELWQRESAIKGVKYRLDNPEATPESQHNNWAQDKLNEGWVYGEVKDAEKKTHPCLVPYEELPEFQRKKDALFCAIVDIMK